MSCTLRTHNDTTPKKGLPSLTDLPGLLSIHAHGHDEHDQIIINPIHDNGVLPSMPSTGAHTPLTEHDDEEAILSDIPSESESELEVAPTTPITQRRHRNATSVSSDDFEFPIFLGRQDEEPIVMDAVPSRAQLRSKVTKTTTQSVSAADFDFPIFLGQQDETYVPRQAVHVASVPNKAVETGISINKSLPAVAPESYPTSLSGPMMSWWPSPIETSKASLLDERLMEAWMRTPKDLTEHEWTEAFYE